MTISETGGALPRVLISARLHRQTLRSILAVEPKRVWKEIGRIPSKRVPFAGALLAWGSFWRLRRLARLEAPGPAPGYCPEFLSFVDPFLRDRVSRIFAEHFRAQPTAEYGAVFARCVEATNRITSPLRINLQPSNNT